MDKCIEEAVFWNWSPLTCHDCEYKKDCKKTGKCPEVQGGDRPEWDDDFSTIYEIYRRTVNLSGYDMNGYPQLTKLEFILSFCDYEISSRSTFLNYLEAIHIAKCNVKSSEIKARSSNADKNTTDN